MEQYRYKHSWTEEDELTEAQRRAMPEYLDMVAEYEGSDEHLKDELQIMFDQFERGQKAPGICTAMSPLQRPTLTRAMSLELDAINLGPSAIGTMISNNASAYGIDTNFTSANTTACPMSPKLKIQPQKVRPTPSPNNPWYWEDHSPESVDHHLTTILNDVHETLSTWVTALSPETLCQFAARSKKNWERISPDRPHLRKMIDGLINMEKFLVCGPKDYLLSRALGQEVFERLQRKAERAEDACRGLLCMKGCPEWIERGIGQPLRAIERLLGALGRERGAWKAERATAEDGLADAVERMEVE